MSSLTPVWNYVDALVHPAAQQDALTAARHRAFIAPRLLGSFVALASFPVYIVFRGVPSALEVGAFAWLLVPIVIAFYLSRTGRYESAHTLSSLSLTGLVTVVALYTGGIGSFAAIWLVVVPLEAALSASRRVVAIASTLALAAAGLLLMLSVTELLPTAVSGAKEHGALAALGIISAALYAIGIALGADSMVGTSFWLLYAEEERYRLLARNMTDVMVRHGRNGTVLFVSPAAEPLFGARLNELLGNGLFDRVHVADRPAYRTALADAASLGEERSLEFRIRRDGADAPRAGSFLWVEMRCRSLDQITGTRDPANREVVAVLRDVRERKAHEREIETARLESERANAAKTRFIATMSHKLRTPLNAIIGFSPFAVGGQRDSRRLQDGDRQFRNQARAVCAGIGNFKLWRSAGAESAGGGNRDQDAARRSAGSGGRPPRLHADPDQSHFECHQVHAARRPDHVDRLVRRAETRRHGRGHRHRHRGNRSAAVWARHFSRRAHPTIAVTTAPVSACRSSRGSCTCTATTSISAAAWARESG